MKILLEKAADLKIVGIIRPNEEAVSHSISGTIAYTYALTEHVADQVNASDIVKQHKENPDIDVFTGLPFKGKDFTEPTAEEKAQAVREYLAAHPQFKKPFYIAAASVMPEDMLAATLAEALAAYPNRASMEAVLKQVFVSQLPEGSDESTIDAYIAKMSDDEVKAALSEVLSMQIKSQYAQKVSAQIMGATAEQIDMLLSQADAKLLSIIYDEYLPPLYSDSSFEENDDILGVFDIDEPSSISIFSSTFEAKDEIAALIEQYNASVTDSDDKITYTDYIKIMMSSITTIINAISYILIAFVSISLVVSSIMIGIITYISVLERTKEIGVLRAVGASKKDVGRVFNAETLIVGFASGMIGIITTALINIPINIIIKALTDIGGIASLPVGGAVILVLISMGLTLIAGLIPAKIAAKKDPVVALRSE
jgi:putative ABC transport system permease protein